MNKIDINFFFINISTKEFLHLNMIDEGDIELVYHCSAIEISAMKLFECIQKSLPKYGIHPSKHEQNSIFNLKNMSILTILTVNSLLMMASTLFLAKSVREKGDCFYAGMADVLSLVYSYGMISNSFGIFKLINELDGFVEKSMSFFGA